MPLFQSMVPAFGIGTLTDIFVWRLTCGGERGAAWNSELA